MHRNFEVRGGGGGEKKIARQGKGEMRKRAD